MDRKLPIGIQSFATIRDDGYQYVDKTEYIYNLEHSGKYYFLSRPRRFGKSLLISTMKSYFEGKEELFNGLRIQELKEAGGEKWEQYPVFHFDFNGENYLSTPLEDVIDSQLRDWEEYYGKQYQNRSLGERFQKLLEMAALSTKRRCVVLVDEYDKPLLETMGENELEERNKNVFKSFFSRLKNADDYIKFAFITGVTKFSKVSIFSDLNQLRDISLSEDYSGVCGVTSRELSESFDVEINNLARKQQMTYEECVRQLEMTYDGYRFHPYGVRVYNPFSLLNAFADGEFGAYWFATGTPSFLVRSISKNGYDIRKFSDRTLYASEGMLSDYRADDPDPTALLYQTGYLTIVDFDRAGRVYTLAFPNNEVKYGFLENLVPEYTTDTGSGSGNDLFTLGKYAEQGNLDGMRRILTALFAGVPYTHQNDPFENYFQTIIYLVFTLLGKTAFCEMHTFNGRIDCVLTTSNYIYLFEFKCDGTAESALDQIESMQYDLPFAADARKLFKIGVAFDSSKRILSDWKVQE